MRITSSLLAAQAMARISNLSPDDVLEALQQHQAVVVDIRELEEVRANGTIAGSIHIPRGMLEFSVDPGSPDFRQELVPDTPIILMCSTGHRSALSTETLTSLGFLRVAHLRGGFEAWARQGLPVQHPESKKRGDES